MTWRSIWQERIGLVRLLGLARRSSVAWLALLVLANGAIPAGLAVSIGVLVSRASTSGDLGLDTPEGRGLLVVVGVVTALVILERLVPPVLDVLRNRVGREVDGALRRRMLVAVERPTGLAHLEDPATQDQLGMVSGGLFGTAGSAAVAAIGIVGRYLQTISSVMVIAWFSVPVAVLVFVVVVAIRRKWHTAFAELAGAMIETFGKMRQATYFADLVLTPTAAKETRIYGLGDWFVDRQHHYWHEATSRAFEVRARLRSRTTLELGALLGAYLVTTVLAARAAAQGNVGLGVLAAVLQAQFWAAQLIAPVPEDYATGAGMAALRAVRSVESDTAPVADRHGPAARAGHEIHFRQVSFVYPGAARPALDGFDLRVRAGESLAIVGANGAGKTTVIKLLCGLYEPTSGDILVDGRPLAELDRRAWTEQFAAVFQDFNRYETTVDDNVGFGDIERSHDRGGKEQAVRDAGALELVESLPRGWGTLLSRRYDDGVDLSGGEWQRIAIARALFALQGGATTLILDEPTANLDVRAEYELFEHLLACTKGATTILISHRFSTVRHADRIVVLDEGRIVEEGAHATLVDQAGIYARMFEAQARAFTASPPAGAGVGDAEPSDA